MHVVKATIQISMTSPANEQKQRYLDENEGVIDTTPVILPKPLSEKHPLAKNLSIKQILYEMQNDVLKLEKEEYGKTLKGDSFLPSKSPILEGASKKVGRNASPAGDSKIQEFRSTHAHKGSMHSGAKILEETKDREKSPGKNSSKNNKVEDSTVSILGTYVRNPKGRKDQETEYLGNTFNRTGVIPSIKAREKPSKRLEREFMMFKEIFVHPKEGKGEESSSTEQLNPIMRPKILRDEPQVEKSMKGKSASVAGKVKVKGADDEEIKELMEEQEANLEGEDKKAVDEVIEIVMKLFNSKIKGRAGESFFSQQIQVQPPEGMNATVAAPLTPGGGWAPSIPNISGGVLHKSSFKVFAFF